MVVCDYVITVALVALSPVNTDVSLFENEQFLRDAFWPIVPRVETFENGALAY